MRIALGLLITAGLLAGFAAQSAAAPARTQTCYQIKNGPFASWNLPAAVARSAGIPREVKGTTWTAFATDVACPRASSARTLLAKYSAARKSESRVIRPALTGFNRCSTSRPGEIGCVARNESAFTLLQTGKYTLPQIKRLAAAGKLPIG